MEKNITYTLTLPEGVDTLTAEMVAFPEGFEGIVLIPEGVWVIGNECFMGRPITAVTFPKSLREIGEWAFAGCRLKELRVEGDGGRIKIGVSAFAYNPDLAAVTLGNCELGYDIFSGCRVKKLTQTDKCIPPPKRQYPWI
jgi:hypothetical protein